MSSQVISRWARLALAVVAMVPLIGIVGCEGESAPTGPITGEADPKLNVLVKAGPFNASSTDTLIRFSFATGALVATGGDWDIALRRYEVRLNGGVSGTKGVTGASLGNNKAATNDQILAFTVDGTRTAFDSVRTAQVPADTAFSADRLFENNTSYLNLAGVPSANAAAYWKVKLANGSFALMRVTAIVLSPQFALTSVTIESRLQTGATVAAAAQTITVPVGSVPVAVSLGTNAVVTANGCNWDLQLNPQSFGMSVNSACSAGTYPGPASPAFAAAASASDAPQYGAFLAGLTGPIPNSITDVSAPFRYNLLGNNRLHPVFNTYIVKVGVKVYKLQVINYYNEAGASGWPTIRYALIK